MTINYATEESFRVYVDYLALKRHFTTDSYDYKKYNGKVRASFDSFQTRNDAFFFYKLSRKKDWHNMILANILKNPNIWVREILEETGEQIYAEWEGRIDALTYTFKDDLSRLKDNYADNFIPVNGQHPYIMTLYLQNKISLETFTILSNISNVYDRWSNEIVDKVVARDIIRLSKKYYPFLEIDRKKFSEIVKERFFG
jgi:hypothetical protein